MSDQQPDPWNYLDEFVFGATPVPPGGQHVSQTYLMTPTTAKELRRTIQAVRAEVERRHAFELSREYERGSADGVARMRVQIDELKQGCEAANRRHAEEIAELHQAHKQAMALYLSEQQRRTAAQEAITHKYIPEAEQHAEEIEQERNLRRSCEDMAQSEIERRWANWCWCGRSLLKKKPICRPWLRNTTLPSTSRSTQALVLIGVTGH